MSLDIRVCPVVGGKLCVGAVFNDGSAAHMEVELGMVGGVHSQLNEGQD